jgi:hypothetical protein
MKRVRFTGERTGMAAMSIPRLGVVRQGEVVELDDDAQARRWVKGGDFEQVELDDMQVSDSFHTTSGLATDEDRIRLELGASDLADAAVTKLAAKRRDAVAERRAAEKKESIKAERAAAKADTEKER